MKVDSSDVPMVKLAMTGRSDVGKSAICVRYLTKRYIHEYAKNEEYTYRRHIQVNNLMRVKNVMHFNEYVKYVRMGNEVEVAGEKAK